MKKRIRLTESDLHRIVNRSVKRVLREGYYDDEKRKYENSYRECIRLLEKAKSAIITDYSWERGYDENDPYYNDLNNRQLSVLNKIDEAISTCENVALNDRLGTFDSEHGYLPDPHFAY